MLPASLLCCEFRGDAAIPRFLSDADRPWIRTLIDECERVAGRPVREVEARLREAIPGAPEDKRRLVAHLLLGFARSRVGSPVPPREVRAALFLAASRAGVAREEVILRTASALGVSEGVVLDSLFADLPGERLAIAPPSLDPADLALRSNLALAQGLLARAHSVRIRIEGNARAVVRHAGLRGLICSVARDSSEDGALLELSGPYALFRRTLLYGRALGAVVPVLAWTRRFHLTARCDIRGRSAVVTLASGDPILPSAEPRRFDSRVEERFARDFAKAAPGWDVIREPEPIEAEGHLLFPDFAIHPRSDPADAPARAASAAVPARARWPSSFTRAASVSGPRELLSTTSWPFATESRASWLPMCPAPMRPMVAIGHLYARREASAAPRRDPAFGHTRARTRRSSSCRHEQLSRAAHPQRSTATGHLGSLMADGSIVLQVQERTGLLGGETVRLLGVPAR